MKPDEQTEITLRLQSAVGHLNAVVEMVVAGKSCEEVLHQLNAVQAALKVAGVKIIHCQAQSSQGVILNSESANQRIGELKRLQSLYRMFVQYFN